MNKGGESLLNKIKKEQAILISTVMLLVLIWSGVFVFNAYMEMRIFEEEYHNQLSLIDRERGQFLHTLIEQNNQKARLNARAMRDEILDKVEYEYDNNYVELEYDILNMAEDNKLSKIFNEVVDGQHINILNSNNIAKKSDSNDPFIVIHDPSSEISVDSKLPLDGEISGIVADKSEDCSIVTPGLRSWEMEIDMHYNKNLVSTAIYALLNKTDTTIFWSFLEPSIANLEKLPFMNVNLLVDRFVKYGKEGISNYEFLVPIYINSKNDILGNAYVDNLGRTNESYMIILVQGYRLYDVFDHPEVRQMLDLFDIREGELEKRIHIYRINKEIRTILIVATFLFCFVALATVQRRIVESSEAKKEDSSK